MEKLITVSTRIEPIEKEMAQMVCDALNAREMGKSDPSKLFHKFIKAGLNSPEIQSLLRRQKDVA